MLEALERDNLFVVPLDDKRHWFRYHHLFADLLRARAPPEPPATCPRPCTTPGRRWASCPKVTPCGAAPPVRFWGSPTGPAEIWRKPTRPLLRGRPVCERPAISPWK